MKKYTLLYSAVVALALVSCDYNEDNFDGFEDWLNEEIRVAKRVTRREWAIGIVCAIIGAAIGLIPYIVLLL